MSEEAGNDRLQLVAAVVLGVAATLTAFSAYKASALGGEALHGYTESTSTLNDANAFYAQSNNQNALDQQLFVQYATAAHNNNGELADYIETLMDENLQGAVEWWKSSEDADTPFDDAEDNPYALEDGEEAQRLEKEAAKIFKEAEAADDQGGKVELSTLTLALTLFFAGVATLFKSRSVNQVMLAVSVVTLVIGTIQLVTAL